MPERISISGEATAPVESTTVVARMVAVPPAASRTVTGPMRPPVIARRSTRAPVMMVRFARSTRPAR